MTAMHNSEENVFDETIGAPQQSGDAFSDTVPSIPISENILLEFEEQQPEILLYPPHSLSVIEQNEAAILLPETTNKKKIVQRQIPTAAAFLIVGIIVGSFFPISNDTNKTKIAQKKQRTETISLQQESASITEKLSSSIHKDTFQNMKLEAKAAYVWDINTHEALFKKNADMQLPLASLAKVMTAITVASKVPKGTVITIDKKTLATEGDTGLLAQEQWRLRDLLEFTLLVSSNDGAEALADVANARSSQNTSTTTPAFVESMNKKAQEIGLTQSYFSNPSGLDTNEHNSGAYGSARDMAHLFEYGLKNIPTALEATTYHDLKITSLSGFIHNAKNTNILIDKIPALIASKTGFTNLAGGNLVIAFEAGPGKQVVVVVLGSTFDGRFTDVEKLVWATLQYIENSK